MAEAVGTSDPNYRYSINQYIGDGAKLLWQISFAGGYLDRSHVKARLYPESGVADPVSFTWVDPTTVKIEPAVAAGVRFIIYRDTPKDKPLAQFKDGAFVTEQNLDRNAMQAVFIAAEAQDTTTLSIKGDAGEPGPEGKVGYASLVELKAALPGRAGYTLATINGPVVYAFVPGNFEGTPPASLDSAVVKLDAVPLRIGALVAMGSQALQTRLNTSVAVSRSQAAKNADFINVLDFATSDEIASGNLTNALEKAMYRAVPEQAAIQLFVPPGFWKVNRQLIPWRQVVLRGAGEMVSVLKFEGLTEINSVMKGAISFGQLSTLNAYATRGDKVAASGPNFTDGAASSQVSDLQIQIGDNAVVGLCSIWSAALVTLKRVFSYRGGFILCAGDLQSRPGTVIGNCNLSRVERCTVLFAIGDSFVFDGSDANNITIDNNNSFQPQGSGYVLGSFLGCGLPGIHNDGGLDGVRVVNPTGALRGCIPWAYSEPNGRGEPWNVDSGTLILCPQGASPVGGDLGKNTTLAATFIAGLWGSQDLTLTWRESDAFGIGDANNAAARYGRAGMQVRDRVGGLGGFVAGGDGTYITYLAPGAMVPENIIKLARAGPIADLPHAAGETVTRAEYNAVVDVINRMVADQRNGLISRRAS